MYFSMSQILFQMEFQIVYYYFIRSLISYYSYSFPFLYYITFHIMIFSN